MYTLLLLTFRIAVYLVILLLTVVAVSFTGIHTVCLKKTSPMFLAITCQSIVGFS